MLDQSAAIARAGDVPFGLGSSVWTNDPVERECFVTEIEAGTTAVNPMLASSPEAPSGGIKRSRYRRELGPCGLHEFLNLKTVSGGGHRPGRQARPRRLGGERTAAVGMRPGK